jgi:hypothetical protein
MILIIHGEDSGSSRNLFFEEKNKAKSPILLSGDGLTYDLLFQALENNSFFEMEVAVFVENFFSKNKADSLEFKKISGYLNSKKDINITFWDGNEVSKGALSSFKSASVKGFSLPKNLFPFLDNIKPNYSSYLITLFNDLLKTTEPEIILFMMIRQLRLLIGVLGSNASSIEEVKRLAPWQMSKLKKQLSYFSNDKLLNTYNKIFELDLNQKTGKSAVNLPTVIDFFLASL